MKKTLVLTLASIVMLALFFLLPKNRQWFSEKIIGYWNDFRKQKNHLDTESRKIERWGNDYTVSKQIENLLLKQANIKNALVLIPPSAYFKARKIDYHVPEPAVFYYYTGVKTTWTNSASAQKANWMVTASDGQLHIIPVNDKKSLTDSIEKLKIYPVAL